MDDRKKEAMAIGAICLCLALIGAIFQIILLVVMVFQKRHSSPVDPSYSQNSLYSRSRSSSRKRNVSSYFFISLWLCLVLDLLTRLLHDVPSILCGRHVLGSNVASIIAWSARCIFYSSILHFVLIVGSAYCNRFDHNRSGSDTLIHCTCLASKIRATLVSLACWLVSVSVATIVKYGICEYQFDPRMYGYVCVHSIHFEGDTEKPSTLASMDETKHLLYLDGSIIGLATLWMIYGNWAIRKQTMRRRRLVEQAQSVLSMNDPGIPTTIQSTGSQQRSELVRMRSNRLISLTAILILRYCSHLLVLDFGFNRWHHLSFTFIDFVSMVICPVIYFLFTKSLRDMISMWRGNGERISQIALTDVSRNVGNEDNRSLFSFTQTPASPVSDTISTSSMARMAEKSPFTTDTHLNNSPSMSTMSAIDKRLVPHSNQSRSNSSSSRYLSVDPSTRNARGHQVSADVHRSDVYTISSVRSFGKVPGINLSPNGQTGSSGKGSLSEQSDKKPNQHTSSPETMTDMDSTTSDTSSLKCTRAAIAIRRRTAWTKEASLDNMEATESLKERAADARRFVEAYEAKNARLQHSLVGGDGHLGGRSIGVLGDFRIANGNGLSAIDEGAIITKKMQTASAMNMEYEEKGQETRCHQDG